MVEAASEIQPYQGTSYRQGHAMQSHLQQLHDAVPHDGLHASKHSREILVVQLVKVIGEHACELEHV